ncbi:MAG: hypothetical protein ACK5DJ_06465 [Bacteroidota bacterium]
METVKQITSAFTGLGELGVGASNQIPASPTVSGIIIHRLRSSKLGLAVNENPHSFAAGICLRSRADSGQPCAID